jgi:hypothetical protein
MDQERIASFLQLHGYGPAKARKMVAGLLEKLQKKGLSEKEAIAHITLDLEKKGRIYQVLFANKSSVPETPEMPVQKHRGFQCPKCGHPQKQGTECMKCGVLFTKLARQTAEKKNKALEITPISASIQRLNEQKAPSPGFSKWLSNNKTLFLGSTILICILIAGTFIQYYDRQKFRDVLMNYRVTLAMASPEEFRASLANLKTVIETAAILVGKWGIPDSDVREYGSSTIDSVFNFVNQMKETAGENKTLYDYDVEKTEKMLCGGIALVMNGIRTEKIAKEFAVRLTLRGRLDCNPAMYEPSTGTGILEKTTENGPPNRNVAERQMAMAELASCEEIIYTMEGHYVDDARKLINACSVGEGGVSQKTQALVSTGAISIELTATGGYKINPRG